MYFTIREMACKCCGVYEMQPDFMNMLERARKLAGIPFNINSAYRCIRHNRSQAVGGKVNSSHTLGYAADIACTSSRDRHIILKALRAAGFNRIGIYKTFIHVDSDPSKPEDVTWLI